MTNKIVNDAMEMIKENIAKSKKESEFSTLERYGFVCSAESLSLLLTKNGYEESVKELIDNIENET